MAEVKSILPELGLLYVTSIRGSYVIWVSEILSTSAGMQKIRIAAVECFASPPLSHAAGNGRGLDTVANCVLEFKLHHKPGGRQGYVSVRSYVRKALEKALDDLVSLIHLYYPCLLRKPYVVYPSPEYLARLDVPENPLRNTILLQKPEDLALYLGSDIPHDYGGCGRPLAELNCLEEMQLRLEDLGNGGNDPEVEGVGDNGTNEDAEHDQTSGVGGSVDNQPGTMLRTSYQTSHGPRLVWADSDMIMKLCHGVLLAKAEAMHLNLYADRHCSALIIECIYSRWNCQVLRQRFTGRTTENPEIIGFIGWLGGYAAMKAMVQFLRDRLPPKLLESENDLESSFWASKYILYQTVQGLKGHDLDFTHGDLYQGICSSVVLLDWGLPGFWPEYCKSYRGMSNRPWRTYWDRLVEIFIPPYYVEYDVMKIFGTVWY
ncbi:uncharacterized protein BDW43DRAFT_320801 [Aspergillus alliaceus]|uniref:uncharacterized protein n=1 Tax=Petromyces alliaceus TaxID=209559 RepID=UPI0012A6ED6B|nr:uncharacterized protein BDW43DRAFT_320801 [Aspergillus alliaceus]KAB8231344.1 hypothetical protein BDW43DRAFT_320801 [Aspergillus alliaceus]